VLYLADTNVLLRFADRRQPLNPMIRNAVRKLRAAGNLMIAFPQNFIEFWNVATRPATQNGLGRTTAEAEWLLRLVERVFWWFPTSPTTYPAWRKLVVAHGVSGTKVHDAHLVAAMREYGVTHILTLNTADFTRYAPLGIVAIDPHTV